MLFGTDLAVFRGSEDPVKCKSCGHDMDTMTAFCGEMVGSEIVRRADPKNRALPSGSGTN
jgi:hypothetical protein